MRRQLDRCVLRSFQPDDAASLARHANDRDVWRNLRDGFPHPYTEDDAKRFIVSFRAKKPETVLAIEVEGEACGAIGVSPHEDVERLSAEIGYWLGREHWGKGIMTEVLEAMTQYAIETFGLIRIFAVPYAWNDASFRVLEKAGYVCEGRLRRSVIKDGQVIDQLLYAYVLEDE